MAGSFPREFTDKEGRTVIVRMFSPEDAQGVYDLFERIPQKWRQFVHEDVDSAEAVGRWTSRLDPVMDLPLVAVRDGKIVAAVSLFRRNRGPLRHHGRLRITVDMEVYPYLVGTNLIDEVLQFARETRLEAVTISLVEDVEWEEIDALVGLGFEKAAVIPRYVKDLEGNLHNMVFLIHRLGH